jgi:hypothetical protein
LNTLLVFEPTNKRFLRPVALMPARKKRKTGCLRRKNAAAEQKFGPLRMVVQSLLTLSLRQWSVS